jgi:hypothetical protein
MTGLYLVVGKFTLSIFVFLKFFVDGAILIYLANLFQRTHKCVGRRHESNDTLPKKPNFCYNSTNFCYCLEATFHPKKKTAIHDLILGGLSWECATKGFTLTFLHDWQFLVLIMYRGRNPFEGFLGFKCLAEG